MAFRLTKTQSKELAAHAARLKEGRKIVDEEFEAVARGATNAFLRVNARIEVFNADVAAVRKFVEEIADGFADDYEEKSDNWKEGDAGQAASDFVDAWKDAADLLDDVDGVSFLEPDGPTFGKVNLEELPEEPE